MGIEFMKEFKCCNFEELYPVVYLPGKKVDTITEASEYDSKVNISVKMAKVAVDMGKAVVFKGEKMDNTEIKNKMMPDPENKDAEILILVKKNTAYDKICKQHGVTKEYIRELKKK